MSVFTEWISLIAVLYINARVLKLFVTIIESEIGLFLGDKLTQSPLCLKALRTLRHLLHRAASFALLMIGFLSHTRPVAQYNCR